ncbi:MAG TPA: ATP-binding protein [Longimicrobiaceae bacterium]|nr:ATP-binding protein [Longimicrobiaceae bacterium]
MSTDFLLVPQDSERARTLRCTGLLDSPPEEAFDRLTRLAARFLAVPVAAITLLDGARQVFKSGVGIPCSLLAPRAFPLDRSVCRYVVGSVRPLLFGDVREDPPSREAAIVRELGMVAYAGVPLIAGGGPPLGTLCVMDSRPREWTTEEVRTLEELAATAGAEIGWRWQEVAMRETERVLRLQRAHLEELFEGAPEGIVLLDPEDRVVRANGEFIRLFGYALEEMAGRPINELILPDELREEGMALTRAVTSGRPVSAETVRRRRDGALVDVSILGKPVHLDDSPVAIYAVYRDITARRRAEEEREAAVAARNRFYATVSHELRTPISAIMLYNDLLLSGAYGTLTETQEEGVQRAQHSASQLLELVNEVLDLAKLEAGKMQTRPEEIHVSEFLRGVTAAVRPVAEQHGCRLIVEDTEAPTLLATDPRRLRQILLNLLSNAVKFGRSRPVRLACVAREDGGVVFEVSDEGPGIPAADIPRIFDEFVQLGDGSQAGTGLGLTISRRLAELLGGTLEVDSTPGVGSTFRLVLPDRSSSS